MASGLRFNLVANFAAQAWTVALGVVFVTVFLHLLGVEAYGLVVCRLPPGRALRSRSRSCDDREPGVSRLRALGREAEGRGLLRTLELTYAGVGVVVGAAFGLTAGRIAEIGWRSNTWRWRRSAWR